MYPTIAEIVVTPGCFTTAGRRLHLADLLNRPVVLFGRSMTTDLLVTPGYSTTTVIWLHLDMLVQQADSSNIWLFYYSRPVVTLGCSTTTGR
jgi:hypothetical protein